MITSRTSVGLGSVLLHALELKALSSMPARLLHAVEVGVSKHVMVPGTIYQANLSSLNYHRWHSPATGTLVEAYLVHGACHTERSVEYFDGTRSE